MCYDKWVYELLCQIFEILQDIEAKPEIEGLDLCPVCDIDTGEIVGYMATIYDEESQLSNALWFDATVNPIDGKPANSQKCPDFESKVLEKCFEDEDGIEYTKYICIAIENGQAVDELTKEFWLYPDGTVSSDAPTVPLKQCGECAKPFTPQCFKKLTRCVGYDNGITVGSSSNNCGLRANFVNYQWGFEVVSWVVNGQVVGQGEALGAYSGWTPQLQGWSDFFNANDVNPNSNAEFGLLPDNTWRYSKITTCDLDAEYGVLKIKRDDGCIFNIYPLFDSTTVDTIERVATIDCDGILNFTFYRDGVEIEQPEDFYTCYHACPVEEKPIIAPDAVSPCTTSDPAPYCHVLDDAVTPVVVVTDRCDEQVVNTAYTQDSYYSATSPDDLVEVDITIGELVNCETGESVQLPCTPVTTVEIEPVCVDFGDGCNHPAFIQKTVIDGCPQPDVIFDSTGEITESVLDWTAGGCPESDKAFIDTCFLPDQYAYQWAWNSVNQGWLQRYDPISQTWTDYGQTIWDGDVIGGYALAFRNDLSDPVIYYQGGDGNLYRSTPDDPISTFTLVGDTNLGRMPCFDYDPQGRLLIGNGRSVWQINENTGASTFLGDIIDARTGSQLNASPGDWFFTPDGSWRMMARDNDGAIYGDCTGTVLWDIDPQTLVATRLGDSCSPLSGTGATWLSAGLSLLSTNDGNTYQYNEYTDEWTLFDTTAPHGINDLAQQWVIPEPIPVFGFIEKGCPDPASCESCLFTLSQDDNFNTVCSPFTIAIGGKFGVCEPEGNPFVTDSTNPDTSSDFCTDKSWNEGCSLAGYTLWREDCNGVREYIYGDGLNGGTTTQSPPPNFSVSPCTSVVPVDQTLFPFCIKATGETIWRKDTLQSDQTTVSEWFDQSGVITPEPDTADIEAGECPNEDPSRSMVDTVVCYEGMSYIRRETENYIEVDGLLELDTYQIVYFNEDGTLWDSGTIASGSPLPTGEPEDYYIGECQPNYITIENVKLCEIDAEYLLLIDSGGVFARYSFYTKKWEEVSTLSVISAGGSTDVENFRLYNFVAPDQLTTVDVNTDTQLPNVTLTSGVLNPNSGTTPLTFSAASFRKSDGNLYAWDTGGADAGLYRVDVNTGTVDFVTTISGVAGTGTSIAIDNTTDRLIINGATNSYEVDWVTGVGTVWDTPPIRANGATFDEDGNFYVSSSTDTWCRDVNGVWTQIIDDFSAGANSIAYYRVEAQSPSCFWRRYGVSADGSRTYLGDFQIGTTVDTPRTVVGEVDCCECSCGGGGGSDCPCSPDYTELLESIISELEEETPTRTLETYWCAEPQFDNLLNWKRWDTGGNAVDVPEVSSSTTVPSDVFTVTNSCGQPEHPNSPDDSGLTDTSRLLEVNSVSGANDPDQFEVSGWVLLPTGTTSVVIRAGSGTQQGDAIYAGSDECSATLQFEVANSFSTDQSTREATVTIDSTYDTLCDGRILFYYRHLVADDFSNSSLDTYLNGVRISDNIYELSSYKPFDDYVASKTWVEYPDIPELPECCFWDKPEDCCELPQSDNSSFDTVLHCDDNGIKYLTTIDKYLNTITQKPLLDVLPNYADCPCEDE